MSAPAMCELKVFELGNMSTPSWLQVLRRLVSLRCPSEWPELLPELMWGKGRCNKASGWHLSKVGVKVPSEIPTICAEVALRKFLVPSERCYVSVVLICRHFKWSYFTLSHIFFCSVLRVVLLTKNAYVIFYLLLGWMQCFVWPQLGGGQMVSIFWCIWLLNHFGWVWNKILSSSSAREPKHNYFLSWKGTSKGTCLLLESQVHGEGTSSASLLSASTETQDHCPAGLMAPAAPHCIVVFYSRKLKVCICYFVSKCNSSFAMEDEAVWRWRQGWGCSCAWAPKLLSTNSCL